MGADNDKLTNRGRSMSTSPDPPDIGKCTALLSRGALSLQIDEKRPNDICSVRNNADDEHRGLPELVIGPDIR